MRALEDLWYGNINPCEQFLEKDTEYFAALRKAGKEQETFLQTLSPEQQKAMEQLFDMQADVSMIAERKAFVAGFRLAVQLIAAAV